MVWRLHSYSAVQPDGAHTNCSDCSLPANIHHCLGCGTSSSAVNQILHNRTILIMSWSVVCQFTPSSAGDYYLQTQAKKSVCKPAPPLPIMPVLYNQGLRRLIAGGWVHLSNSVYCSKIIKASLFNRIYAHHYTVTSFAILSIVSILKACVLDHIQGHRPPPPPPQLYNQGCLYGQISIIKFLTTAVYSRVKCLSTQSVHPCTNCCRFPTGRISITGLICSVSG